jgi:hypothetical protein
VLQPTQLLAVATVVAADRTGGRADATCRSAVARVSTDPRAARCVAGGGFKTTFIKHLSAMCRRSIILPRRRFAGCARRRLTGSTQSNRGAAELRGGGCRLVHLHRIRHLDGRHRATRNVMTRRGCEILRVRPTVEDSQQRRWNRWSATIAAGSAFTSAASQTFSLGRSSAQV